MTILFLALAILAVVAATIGFLGKDNAVVRNAGNGSDGNCSTDRKSVV